MTSKGDYKNEVEIEWCPGCGNFGILASIKNVLSGLDITPHEILMVSGIGQSGKLPHYLRCNVFNGLHGRAIPLAIGAKVSNHDLNVIAVGGDGDMYGEGGNHFIHAVRRNPNITVIVHDNQIYGLTKGQASPTSEIGMKTKVQKHGVMHTPFNSLATAISLDCTFVSRGFAGDVKHLSGIIKQAIEHKGLSLVDVLQPCVTFNRLNTFKWYNERVYKLEETDYNPNDKTKAFEKSMEWGDNIPIGVFYKREGKPTFEDNLPVLESRTLVNQETDSSMADELMDGFT